MAIENSIEVTLDELKTIIHGLRMSTFSFVEVGAIDEIQAMIKVLPLPEDLAGDKMLPVSIKQLQKDIGNIMRLIEIYGKRDMEFKTRYKSRTGLPPRYKVLDWRINMEPMQQAASNFTKGLVKTSAVMDDLGYGDVSSQLIKCAKKTMSNELSSRDFVDVTANVLEKIGFIKEAGDIRKVAQTYDLTMDDVTGGLDQLNQSIDGIISSLETKNDQLVNVPSAKGVIGLIGSLWNQLKQFKQNIQKPIQSLEQSLPQIQEAMQEAVPTSVAQGLGQPALKIEWTPVDETTGEQTAYVVKSDGKKYEVQRASDGKLIATKPLVEAPAAAIEPPAPAPAPAAAAAAIETVATPAPAAAAAPAAPVVAPVAAPAEAPAPAETPTPAPATVGPADATKVDQAKAEAEGAAKEQLSPKQVEFIGRTLAGINDVGAIDRFLAELKSSVTSSFNAFLKQAADTLNQEEIDALREEVKSGENKPASIDDFAYLRSIITKDPSKKAVIIKMLEDRKTQLAASPAKPAEAKPAAPAPAAAAASEPKPATPAATPETPAASEVKPAAGSSTAKPEVPAASADKGGSGSSAFAPQKPHVPKHIKDKYKSLNDRLQAALDGKLTSGYIDRFVGETDAAIEEVKHPTKEHPTKLDIIYKDDTLNFLNDLKAQLKKTYKEQLAKEKQQAKDKKLKEKAATPASSAAKPASSAAKPAAAPVPAAKPAVPAAKPAGSAKKAPAAKPAAKPAGSTAKTPPAVKKPAGSSRKKAFNLSRYLTASI